MTELFVGIALVVGLILVQVGASRWRVHQTRRAWEAAQDAAARGDFEEAEKRLRTAMRRMPMWTAARYMLGEVLAREGKLKEAEDQFKMASALEPRSAAGHFALGMFYAKHRPDRVQEALSALDEALDYDPGLRLRMAEARELDHLRDDPTFQRMMERAAAAAPAAAAE